MRIQHTAIATAVAALALGLSHSAHAQTTAPAAASAPAATTVEITGIRASLESRWKPSAPQAHWSRW